MANIDEIKFVRTNTSKLESVQEDYPISFIHLHDNNEDNLYIGECRMTDNFNIGSMDDDTNTIKVGGLEASTLGDLKKKSMSEIIMDMVCPLTYPKIQKYPSITLSYSGSTLVKVGSTLPSKSDIKISTDSGKWSDGTDYAGTCGDVTLTISPDSWNMTSEEKVYTISGTGTFSEGGTPKDSHGNDYNSGVYKGGNVTSNEIKITSVYPIYINDSDINVMSEYLIDYNTLQTEYVTIPAEVDGTLDKFKVYLPSVFSTFEVKQYNSVSGKYDITINMVLIDGETSKYIRTNDLKDTNTDVAKYEIKLKK